MKYVSPYCYVPVPVDCVGRGPEMNPKLVVRTHHYVWDGCNLAVCETEDEETARCIAEALNYFLGDVPTGN